MGDKLEIKIAHLPNERVVCHDVCSEDQKTLVNVWLENSELVSEVQEKLSQKYSAMSGTFTKQTNFTYVDESGMWTLIHRDDHF